MNVGDIAYIDCPTDVYLNPVAERTWGRVLGKTYLMQEVEEWQLMMPLTETSGLFVRVA